MTTQSPSVLVPAAVFAVAALAIGGFAVAAWAARTRGPAWLRWVCAVTAGVVAAGAILLVLTAVFAGMGGRG